MAADLDSVGMAGPFCWLFQNVYYIFVICSRRSGARKFSDFKERIEIIGHCVVYSTFMISLLPFRQSGK